MENKINANEINIDVKAMLHEAEHAAEEQGKIPVFLLDTIYGKGVLMNRNAEDFLLDEKEFALPVKLEENSFLYEAETKDNDWLLFPEMPLTVDSEKYIIPIDIAAIIKNGNISGTAFTKDEIHLGKLLQFVKENSELVLPEIRWKVTKPGMVCRGEQYALGMPYLYDGPIYIHKSGYHYATDPMALFTWYRRFDPKNEVYLVQVGGESIEGDTGVGVTNNL